LLVIEVFKGKLVRMEYLGKEVTRANQEVVVNKALQDNKV
jgi:hypothetical protein